MQKRKLANESGRTMVEMIAVLAIIGLISFVSIAMFRLVLNKTRATAIVHDARLAFVEILTQETPVAINQWILSSSGSESSKTFYMMRDIKENNYVKVESVEEGVCEQMLSLQRKDELTFWTETYAPFENCAEGANLIVMSFDGAGTPQECTQRTDCGEYFEGKCNADGKCAPCDETLEQWDEEKMLCACNSENAQTCTLTEEDEDEFMDEEDDEEEEKPTAVWCCPKYKYLCGATKGTCLENPHECDTPADCVKANKMNHYCDAEHQCVSCGDFAAIDVDTNICKCNSSLAITCASDDNTWCCGNGKICDIANETCQETDNWCEYLYNFSDFEIQQSATCAYNFQIANATIERATNCAYTVTIIETSSGQIAAMQPKDNNINNACTGNTYCAMTYSNYECRNFAEGNTTTIYGTCLPTNNFKPTCETDIKGSVSLSPVIDASKGLETCAEGTYCAMTYSNYGCRNFAEGNTTTIYGTCLPTNNFKLTCKTEVKGAVTFKPIPGRECPAGTFCALTWKNKSCQQADGGTTYLYGRCQNLNELTAQCP